MYWKDRMDVASQSATWQVHPTSKYSYIRLAYDLQRTHATHDLQWPCCHDWKCIVQRKGKGNRANADLSRGSIVCTVDLGLLKACVSQEASSTVPHYLIKEFPQRREIDHE